MIAFDIYSMATSIRHNKLCLALVVDLYVKNNLQIQNKSLQVFSESIALVHYGSLKDCNPSLVVIEEVENMNIFCSSIIDSLSYVQPDFIVFNKNKLLTNKSETKLAGCPDLIVEIWSEGNTPTEKSQKFILYSSYRNTEHWYIEQYSNVVKCFLGHDELSSQNLNNILFSSSGLEFDLRYLALKGD